MPKHSTETKDKIADSLKKHYQEKKHNSQRPTRRRREELHDKFVEGHPDGMEPAAVRNFGDIGPDVNFITPKTKRQTAEEKNGIPPQVNQPPPSQPPPATQAQPAAPERRNP